MTEAQIEFAEQRMQQQWHDLVMAEQAGQPLEILEQMYDTYILFAEEYNACQQLDQRQKQDWHNARVTRPLHRIHMHQQDAKLAS